jgi:hypothetical protein
VRPGLSICTLTNVGGNVVSAKTASTLPPHASCTFPEDYMHF